MVAILQRFQNTFSQAKIVVFFPKGSIDNGFAKSRPVLTYWQLEPQEQTSMQLKTNYGCIYLFIFIYLLIHWLFIHLFIVYLCKVNAYENIDDSIQASMC